MSSRRYLAALDFSAGDTGTFCVLLPAVRVAEEAFVILRGGTIAGARPLRVLRKSP